jgi:hypothetical protein
MSRWIIAVLFSMFAYRAEGELFSYSDQSDTTLFFYSTDNNGSLGSNLHELVETKNQVVSIALSFMPSSGIGSYMLIADIRTDIRNPAEVKDQTFDQITLGNGNNLSRYSYSIADGDVIQGVSLTGILPDFVLLDTQAEAVRYGHPMDQNQMIYRVTWYGSWQGSDAPAVASINVPEPGRALIMCVALFFLMRRPKGRRFL